MPKRGFTCLTISETLKGQLSAIAKSQGVSIPSLIEQLLTRTSTVLVQNGGTTLYKEPQFSLISENPLVRGVGPPHMFTGKKVTMRKIAQALHRRRFSLCSRFGKPRSLMQVVERTVS